VLIYCFAQYAEAQPAIPADGAAAQPEPAGKVVLVEGDVRVFDKNLQSRRPEVGSPVFEGEAIVTGSSGEVHLDMADSAYIGVRPNTRLRIARYRAEGDDDDRAVIGLLKGSFRTVTGWIAQFNPSHAVVRTPTATIGVRGTEHEPYVIPEGSATGEPGTYDRVYIGETAMRNAQGTVRVTPGRAGFASRAGISPRVLERVPGFFRPTRNEGRFEGLHERIHSQLDKRREERARQIHEQRKLQPQHDGEHKAQGGERRGGKAKGGGHRRK